MIMGLDITIWLLGALLVVGLTEWIKGFLFFIPQIGRASCRERV